LDKDIFYISIFMLVISIGAQIAWLLFAKIPCPNSGEMPQFLGLMPCSSSATIASFQEIQNVSGYIMIFAFILLPIGLFKDGMPIPGPGAKVFLGVLLVLILGLAATYVLTIPVSAPGPKAVPCGTTSSGSTVYVCMGPGTSLTFSPQNITVQLNKNATVQWSNDGTVAHTTTSYPGQLQAWDSGDLNPGQAYKVTFTTPGTYHYLCTIHGAIMSGYVIVQPKT
jgi:plastocyanin